PRQRSVLPGSVRTLFSKGKGLLKALAKESTLLEQRMLRTQAGYCSADAAQRQNQGRWIPDKDARE
ncbi:hypothetical protein, partial [Desulfatibacillum alkenivorans]|uniref:hypothetical protein n=1 Tax=Desulfatibacillum alkenivorans TaxID=259354 RepID=UPI001B8D8383